MARKKNTDPQPDDGQEGSGASSSNGSADPPDHPPLASGQPTKPSTSKNEGNLNQGVKNSPEAEIILRDGYSSSVPAMPPSRNSTQPEPKVIFIGMNPAQASPRDSNGFLFGKTILRDLTPFEETVVVRLEIIKQYMAPIAFLGAPLLAVLFLISPWRDSAWNFFVDHYKVLLPLVPAIWASKKGVNAYRGYRAKKAIQLAAKATSLINGNGANAGD